MSIRTKTKKAVKLLENGNLGEFSKKFDTFFTNKLNMFSVSSAIREVGFMKEQYKKSGSVEELVDSLLRIKVLKPTQIRSEIIALLEIVKKNSSQNILEIGTANGGTIFSFARMGGDDAVLATVDLPNRAFGYGYPSWRARIYRSFPAKGQKINLVRGDSHSNETFEEVERVFGSSNVDFLFIDGDHSYEGVKKDFEMYGQLVKKGGVVAFHDIVDGDEEFVGGVPRFWSEIKNNYRHDELVHDWNQGGLGIGVLYI